MKLVGHMIKSCEDPRISLLVWSIKPMIYPSEGEVLKLKISQLHFRKFKINTRQYLHVCDINKTNKPFFIGKY